MQYIGIIPALVLFKGLGIFGITQLKRLGSSLTPLFFVCGIYTAVAVSWILILLGNV